MQGSKGGRHPTVLTIYDAYSPHKQSAWNENRKGAVVAHILWWVEKDGPHMLIYLNASLSANGSF